MSKLLYIGLIMLFLDSIYLSIFKNYFKNQIESVQKSPFNMKFSGAILCYICLIYGLNYFIIEQNKSYIDAFKLGIVIYGVYEFTNYSILNDWSYKSVILDTVWGGLLFGLTTYIIQYLKI